MLRCARLVVTCDTDYSCQLCSPGAATASLTPCILFSVTLGAGIPDHLQLPVSEGPWAWHKAGPLGYGGVGGSWGGPGSGIGGDTGGVETAAAPSAGADDAMMAMYQQFGQEGASPSASQVRGGLKGPAISVCACNYSHQRSQSAPCRVSNAGQCTDSAASIHAQRSHACMFPCCRDCRFARAWVRRRTRPQWIWSGVLQSPSGPQVTFECAGLSCAWVLSTVLCCAVMCVVRLSLLAPSCLLCVPAALLGAPFPRPGAAHGL